MRIIPDMALVVILFSVLLSGDSSIGQTALPSHPLRDDSDLDVLIREIGDRKIVLLGEATHGTEEFYEWRSRLSKRLIAEKGFTIIGVEGEWADSYRINQFVKGGKRPADEAVKALKTYDRWPTWMWANYQIADFIGWLNDHNQKLEKDKRAGFYGLDVYCLWESMQELRPFIKGNKEIEKLALEVEKCFKPFSSDPSEYASAVAMHEANCREQVERLYRRVMELTTGEIATTEAGFLMQQNALVAMNGEKYYRTSVRSYPDSWNVRDRHMMETIKRLMEFGGADAKIIIWEHNTHVGDARQTDMAASEMVNVGQLAREHYGDENVYIVGFGTNRGTVTAADGWNGRVEKMRVPSAQKGTWEHILHDQSEENRILLSSELRKSEFAMKTWGHRAIGVVYDPGNERGNYVPSIVPKRYDAFIYIDKTSALKHIPIKARNEPPDTYPSGF